MLDCVTCRTCETVCPNQAITIKEDFRKKRLSGSRGF